MRWSLTVLVAVITGLLSMPLSTGPEEQAAVPIKVVSWNICGEFNGCPKIATAAEMAGKRDTIRKLVDDQRADAIMLQETCEWYASTVLQRLNEAAGNPNLWHMSFAAARQFDDGRSTDGTVHTAWPGRRTRTCSNDRWKTVIEPDATDHALGVAILTKGAHDETTNYELPSPKVQWSTTAPLLCVRRTADPVRLCVSHLTAPGVDTTGEWRRKQIQRMSDIVTSFGDDRVVLGGDLNTYPPGGDEHGQSSNALNPVYALMRECHQAGTEKGGPASAVWKDGRGKLDYLFVRGEGGATGQGQIDSCRTESLTGPFATWSDHMPLIGSFLL